MYMPQQFMHIAEQMDIKLLYRLLCESPNTSQNKTLNINIYTGSESNSKSAQLKLELGPSIGKQN